MQVSESTITMGEHTTLGPVRIELHQPSATPSPVEPTLTQTDALLSQVISELKLIFNSIDAIHRHLTRPPWWRRLWERIRHVAFSR